MFDSPFLTPATTAPFWLLVTRLGEAQILLPAAVLALLALMRQTAGRTLALWWLAALSAAVFLTTASKVAFIGWGVGWPALDFTGVSGHAMFAAAIYPLLFGTLVPSHPLFAQPVLLPGQVPPQVVVTWRWVGLAAGAALALVIAISRAKVNTHSVSEVLAGLAVGGAVSAIAVWQAGLSRGRIGIWTPALALVWLALTPAYAPASQTHPLVTRLALKLAGHQQPYMRQAWLHEWRARNLL